MSVNDGESSKSMMKRAANHPQRGTCEKSMKTSIQLPDAQIDFKLLILSWDGQRSNRQRNSQGLADLTCTTDKTEMKFRVEVLPGYSDPPQSELRFLK